MPSMLAACAATIRATSGSAASPAHKRCLTPRRSKPAADQLEVELLAASIEADEAQPGLGAAFADRPRLRSFVGRVVRVGAEVAASP